MLTTLRSIWTWAAATLIIVLWLPLLALVRLFDRDPARYRTGLWFRRLGATLTRIVPTWTIEVSGADLIEDPRRPYVFVCNHQSLADIPIISRLPWEMKWIAKAELFRIPVVGWMMRLAGDIAVERGLASSGGKALVLAKSYLERHCSVMFFPEGTRSRNGQVLPFTDGAFRLAIKAGVPIVPLALDGAQEALPKHSWKLEGRSAIRLQVLAPIPTEGLRAADTAALRERVRGQILAQIAAWRDETPAAVDAAVQPPPKDSIKTASPIS